MWKNVVAYLQAEPLMAALIAIIIVLCILTAAGIASGIRLLFPRDTENELAEDEYDADFTGRTTR